MGRLAGFGLLAGGAAGANWGAGGAIRPNGDPGEHFPWLAPIVEGAPLNGLGRERGGERLVTFGADGAGAEVAPAVEADVAGDQLGLPEVSLKERHCGGEQVGQAQPGYLAQAGVRLAGLGRSDGRELIFHRDAPARRVKNLRICAVFAAHTSQRNA